MKKIPLTRGMYALVDDRDYDWLIQYKWHVVQSGTGWNAARSEGTAKNIRMHRQIMNAPEGLVVDHINGNALDNRRKNLRLCTHTENNRNRPNLYRNNKSGHKYINWHRQSNKWRVQVPLNGKLIEGGKFSNLEDAIKARDGIFKERESKKHESTRRFIADQKNPLTYKYLTHVELKQVLRQEIASFQQEIMAKSIPMNDYWRGAIFGMENLAQRLISQSKRK